MLPNLGNTVGFMAHPDDLWYSCAATLRKTRRGRRLLAKWLRIMCRRNRVTSISATNGGAGSRDHKKWHPKDIGKIREAEEKKAFRRIGVKDVRFLRLPDGELDKIPFEEGVQLILALLRKLDPDTVITYGPDGLTGHPDHKAMYRWVTEAVIRWIAENIAAGKTPHVKLLYVVADHNFVTEVVPVLHKDDAIYAEPTAVHADNLFVNLWLDDEENDIKQAGIGDHHTQSDPLGKGIGGLDLLAKFWFRHETLVEADLDLLVELQLAILLSPVA